MQLEVRRLVVKRSEKRIERLLSSKMMVRTKPPRGLKMNPESRMGGRLIVFRVDKGSKVQTEKL